MLALSIDFVVRVQPRCLPAVSGGRGDVGRDRYVVMIVFGRDVNVGHGTQVAEPYAKIIQA